MNGNPPTQESKKEPIPPQPTNGQAPSLQKGFNPKEFASFKNVLLYVVVVLVLMGIQILIDAWRSKDISLDKLSIQINVQNTEIQRLNYEIKRLGDKIDLNEQKKQVQTPSP